MMKMIVVFGFAHCLTGGASVAGGDVPERLVPSRVLFVGNSYTSGIKGALNGMFSASPHRRIEFAYIHPGGCTLERHLGNEKTLTEIRRGRWDVVVLQEQSQTPAYPGHRERFIKAATGLDALVREAGAETVFYQTWGRRDGDRKNAGVAPDFETMQDLLSEGYARAAMETSSRIAPVGEAWRAVWKEDAELAKTLYKGDGSHPSKEGAYLAACVIYTLLTGDDPAEVDYDAGLPDGVVRTLREAAKVAAGAPEPAALRK